MRTLGLRFLGVTASLLQLTTAAETVLSPVWESVSVTLPGRTVTVNPSDPTITVTAAGAVTSYVPEFITTTTITTNCITYQESFPPPKSVSRATKTWTATYTTVTTVTDTNRPIQTQTSTYWPTVTVTTSGKSYLEYHCTNTMVIAYADWEYLTYTWINDYDVHWVTTACLTSITRSTTIPGFSLPSEPETTNADWEWFTDPDTTHVTKHTVVVRLEDFASRFGYTSTECVNPSPVTTRTYTAVRETTTYTTTVTSSVPGCVTPTPGVKDKREGDEIEERQVRSTTEWWEEYRGTPVEVQTVVYTTVTVISNTVYTLTGTAVVDVVTEVFPTTRGTITTRTVTGAMTVCY
jgi:hypothetical protein